MRPVLQFSNQPKKSFTHQDEKHLQKYMDSMSRSPMHSVKKTFEIPLNQIILNLEDRAQQGKMRWRCNNGRQQILQYVNSNE